MFVFWLSWLVWFTLLVPFLGFYIAAGGAVIAAMIVISDD